MPNIGPTACIFSISASARPPVILPPGRLLAVALMLSSPGEQRDEVTRGHAGARAGAGRDVVDVADHAILVAGLGVADARARRRHGTGGEPPGRERRQTRG